MYTKYNSSKSIKRTFKTNIDIKYETINVKKKNKKFLYIQPNKKY